MVLQTPFITSRSSSSLEEYPHPVKLHKNSNYQTYLLLLIEDNNDY